MIHRYAAVALLALSFAAAAQTTAPNGEQSFPRFTTNKGRLDSDGFPTSGARLCLLPEKTTCFQMPSQPIQGGGGNYDFGLAPRSYRHALAGGGSWVLFAATFNAGGSGSLIRFALLRFTAQRTLQNLLPDVALVDESEAALWDVPNASAYPLLVTAEPYWDMEHGESHFEAHRQKMQIYRFDAGTQQYVSVLKYRTTRKYGGDDGKPASSVGPLKGEREQALQRLAAAH